tara:strand:- start:463 stop:828 length:366 start_codon:yes stop_codon:yes gene_type:complete
LIQYQESFSKKLNSISELDKVKFSQRTNKDRLKAIGNIYFLYSNGEMKYIVQGQAKGRKTRLNQHLFGKSFSVNKHNVQNGTINLFFLYYCKKNYGINYNYMHPLWSNVFKEHDSFAICKR